MTQEHVSQTWQRIESWLREYAPATYGALPPPATREEIAAAENDLGLTLPTELADSLLCHNGSDPMRLPPVYVLLGTRSIVDHQQLQVEIENETRQEYLAQDIPLEIDGIHARWHPEWIAFASDDGGGYLAIDDRPGMRRGRIGSRDEIGEISFPPDHAWESLSSFLRAAADALETGDPFNGFRRTVDDSGRLGWDRVADRG
ncbi:SMI1/KNR4 family protein [Streptomyces fimicarius]|uniref:SMI1/KNR4 family protein n=1 Tax=Streptomyces griseus TaxID=1911 RepID=UPI0035DCBDD9